MRERLSAVNDFTSTEVPTADKTEGKLMSIHLKLCQNPTIPNKVSGNGGINVAGDSDIDDRCNDSLCRVCDEERRVNSGQAALHGLHSDNCYSQMLIDISSMDPP